MPSWDRFHDWIIVEFTHTLQEDFPGIIDHITDRLVGKFENKISTIQETDGIVKVTREREHGMDMQLGNRKQTHDPNLLTKSKQLDVSMPSAKGLRSHDIFDGF